MTTNPWELIYEDLKRIESAAYRADAIAEITARSQTAGIDLTPSDFIAIEAFPALSPQVFEQVSESPGVRESGVLNSWRPAIATLLQDSTGEAFGINLRYIKAHLQEGDTKAIRLSGGGKEKAWQERAGLLPGAFTSNVVIGAEGADFQAQYLNRHFGLPTYQGLGSGGAIYRDIDRIRVAREMNGWKTFLLALDRPYKKDSETEINRSVARTVAKNVVALQEAGFEVKVLSFYDTSGRQIAPDDGVDRYEENVPQAIEWLKTEIDRLQEAATLAVQSEQPARPTPVIFQDANEQMNQDFMNEIAARIDMRDFGWQDGLLIARFYMSINDEAGFEQAWTAKISAGRHHLSQKQADWRKATAESGEPLMKLANAIAKRIGINRSDWMKQWWRDHPEFKSKQQNNQSTPKPVLIKKTLNPILVEEETMTTAETSAQNFLVKAINLKDLVAPRTHDILNGNIHKNEEWSFSYVVIETVGWENFAKKYGIPIAGSSEAFIQQARERFRFTSDSADRLLRSVELESAVPACIHVESKEKEKYSETAAWAHIYRLDKDIFDQKCPEQIASEVLDRLRRYNNDEIEVVAEPEAPHQVKTGSERLVEAPVERLITRLYNPEPLDGNVDELLNRAIAPLHGDVLAVDIDTKITPQPQIPDEASPKEASIPSHYCRLHPNPRAEKAEPSGEPVSSQDRAEPVSLNEAAESSRQVKPDALQQPAPNQSQPEEFAVDVVIPDPARTQQPEINQSLAHLAREYISVANPRPDSNNTQTINGRSTHKVVLNLTTNTLKVYSNQRNGELILTDTNGKIDHANSKASPKDVEIFEVALATLKQRVSEQSQQQQAAAKRQPVVAKR